MGKILTMVILGLISGGEFLLLLKSWKKISFYKRQLKNSADALNAIEENIAYANKQKAKLNTGDTDTDFINSLNIVHELASD